MNIDRSLARTGARLRGLFAVAACLALSACGQNQNWSQSPAFITIGGTVSNLNGTLVINDNTADPLTVTANGPFTFALSLASGAAYSVAITAQPAGQNCTLTNASGTATSNVTNIAISCANVYSIGGTIANLNGTIVLQNNGVNSLSVTGSGAASTPFTFTRTVASDGPYAVTIQTQPSGQTCAVTAGGSGNATANVTSVVITCAAVYTIGGTIANLNGTIVLENNGGNNLSVTGSGAASTPFTFTNTVAGGSAYAVTIQTQPSGQTCTIAAGSGTATANVTSVAISCASQPFTLRPLPAIYTTGKAINYSAYRAGGPNVGEIVSDADITQDLQLLVAAGYNLIRLFGGDANSESVVRIASTVPGLQSLRFHAGSYLEGANAQCVDSSGVNAADLAKLIEMANTYSNIVAVSVGNETSFAGNLPVNCLVQYIQQVRSAVTQPVTADDDVSFYIGASSTGEQPGTVLANIDFVAYHDYPFSDNGEWDWQQLGVDLNINAVNGATDRANAMMAASIAELQTHYTALQNFQYKNAAGTMTTIGATLPLVLTETGWKYKPTNADPIERVLNPAIAAPVNAKWYADLLASYLAGGTQAPENVFLFEAFNEIWKGTDSGWGLWDETRTPLYGLCGTAVPNAPACTSPIYTGAGYDH
jgi:exo-beta-1,3-glucanase (GH17 family)